MLKKGSFVIHQLTKEIGYVESVYIQTIGKTIRYQVAEVELPTRTVKLSSTTFKPISETEFWTRLVNHQLGTDYLTAEKKLKWRDTPK